MTTERVVRHLAALANSHGHRKDILPEGVPGQTANDVEHLAQLGRPFRELQRVLLAGGEFSLVLRVGVKASQCVAGRAGIQPPLMSLSLVVEIVWKKKGKL